MFSVDSDSDLPRRLANIDLLGQRSTLPSACGCMIEYRIHTHPYTMLTELLVLSRDDTENIGSNLVQNVNTHTHLVYIGSNRGTAQSQKGKC